MGANTIRHDIHNSSFNKAAACWQNHEFLTFFYENWTQSLYICVTSEIGLGSIYHLRKAVQPPFIKCGYFERDFEK